ncbi:ead/Ea22-like family protein, partial [Azotobacter vinelandii]|uniref:ead/Ea22-like family protein n=1 Tax=Azotobacter vinelandii TaxID=354 RepID=UPI00091F8F6A
EVVVWWGSGYNGIPVTADAEFIAAANPAAILELIAENEALKAEAGECFEDALRHARAADELEVERDPLKAELERVRADAELLRKHLTECADSLESEILDRYGLSKDHPAMRRKFECDMQEVIDARAAMGKGGRADV